MTESDEAATEPATSSEAAETPPENAARGRDVGGEDRVGHGEDLLARRDLAARPDDREADEERLVRVRGEDAGQAGARGARGRGAGGVGELGVEEPVFVEQHRDRAPPERALSVGAVVEAELDRLVAFGECAAVFGAQHALVGEGDVRGGGALRRGAERQRRSNDE